MLHGHHLVQPGDLVNIDVSAEKGGYFADSATTVPVPPITQEFPDTLCLFTPEGICLDVIPGAAAPVWLAEAFGVGKSFDQSVPAASAEVGRTALRTISEDLRVFELLSRSLPQPA